MSKEEITEHFCGLGSIRNVHSNCAQLYRADKIKELEKAIQKEEKTINKINIELDKLDKKLSEFEDIEPIDN